MRYSRSISNYPEIITLSDPTYMMSIVNPVAISTETLRIDSGYSLEKEFVKFIYMNS